MRPHILIFCLLPACPGDVAQDTMTPPTTTTAPDTGGPDPDSGTSGGATEASAPTTTVTSPVSTTTGELTTTAELTTTITGDSATTAETTTAGTSDTATDATTDATTGPSGVCGDGHRDPGEDCDDADDDDADECRDDCTFGPGSDALHIPLAVDEKMTCLTSLTGGLALGGIKGKNTSAHARVVRVQLADTNPPAWAWLGDPNSASTTEAATGPGDQIVVAGHIYMGAPDEQDPKSYPWFARLTPDGALMDYHEFPDSTYIPRDLEVTASGDIIVLGDQQLLSFTPDGVLSWQHQNIDENFAGVVAEGKLHVVSVLDDDTRVRVLAFAPDGAPLWTFTSESIAPLEPRPVDLTRTTDDQLVFAARQLDDDANAYLPALVLGAADTAGAPLWSTLWTPAGEAPFYPDALLPADDGGFYLTATRGPAPYDLQLTRFVSGGAELWTKTADNVGRAEDVTRGDDGMIYALTELSVVAFAP